MTVGGVLQFFMWDKTENISLQERVERIVARASLPAQRRKASSGQGFHPRTPQGKKCALRKHFAPLTPAYFVSTANRKTGRSPGFRGSLEYREKYFEPPGGGARPLFYWARATRLNRVRVSFSSSVKPERSSRKESSPGLSRNSPRRTPSFPFRESRLEDSSEGRVE